MKFIIHQIFSLVRYWSKHVTWANIPQFLKPMDNKHNSLKFGCENMLGYLSLDIICSSKLAVFLELRSWKTVHFSEQIMSADKYPSIFSRQMKAIVYICNMFTEKHQNILKNLLYKISHCKFV